MKKYILFLFPIIVGSFLLKLVFFNHVPLAGDLLAHKPIAKWTESVKESTDEFPQWFPNLFSGMPSYGGYIYTPGDPSKTILNLLFYNRGIKIWFYLTLSGLGLFYLLRQINVSILASIFAGLVSCLTPYTFGLINAGHMNKIFAMAFIPWVLMGALQINRKPTLKSILFLSLVTALQLWANHPQIVYYTWMVIGFYWVWELGASFKNKSFEIKKSAGALGGILAGLVIALLMVSDPYIDIFKFQNESNRGAKSVLDQTGETESGASWNYATQWSFHPKETVSFLYPYHYGLQNFSTQDIKSASYRGFMPFTQSTHYLGLVAIIFAILGTLLKKPDKFEWFLWSTTLLALITGFGSFFPILFKPFFSILPFFAKFRIPSMIYVLLALTIPILAAKGLDRFINYVDKKDALKKSMYVAGGIFSLTLILLLIGEAIFDFSSPKDARYNPSIISQILNVRIELFQKGLLLALAVSSSILGLVWSFHKKKINKEVFASLIIGIAVLDIWVVSQEFLNLKPAKNMDLNFQKSNVVDYLMKDKDHFRIFPADEFNSNKYSYWNLESIGGYRPIKLRNYQDLMDAKGFSKPHILNMLNVKYVVTRKKINNPDFIQVNQNMGLYQNKKSLPKAWIVGQVNSVETQRESLMSTLLTGFNPANDAVVVGYKGEPKSQFRTGSVTIRSRHENRIEMDSESESGGFLVLSEIYYKPGWVATVNGEETEIYQTNHVLRGIDIPAGQAEVVFYYNDGPWKKTRILSRSSLLIILFGLGFIIWKEPKTNAIIE
ncbi:YfhO family protein [Candidatus Marinimicrobia bacterium]|nr:YfhO family protein [Candidatus Neomarinimicrobiota bacterium]